VSTTTAIESTTTTTTESTPMTTTVTATKDAIEPPETVSDFPVVPVAVGAGVGVPVLVIFVVGGLFAYSRRKKATAAPARDSMMERSPSLGDSGGKEMSEYAAPPIIDYGNGALGTVAPDGAIYGDGDIDLPE
jgi:hypothetical protein